MKLHGTTALVTGAKMGLGRQFAEQLLERGAKKVYVTARQPEFIDIPGVEAITLDITDSASVASVAAAAGDVELLINNAAVFPEGGNLVDADLTMIRQTMDTNFYGTLAMVRAFAPILAANGGGAILNVLSAMAWMSYDGSNAYAASKSAEWGLTNGVRVELAGQGTLVSGLVFGMAATESLKAAVENMVGTGAVPVGMMTEPAEIARIALDGLEAGKVEIIADHIGVTAKASLAGDPLIFDLGAMLTS